MSMAVKYGMNKRRKMAEGGTVHEKLDYTELKPGDRKGQSRAGVEVREAARQRGHGDADSHARAKRAEGRAKGEHHAVLHDLKNAKKPNLYAEGGDVKDDDDDFGPAKESTPINGTNMVDRAMSKRKKMAAGGTVGPAGADDTEDDFDVLDEDDDLDSSYTGADSGDELGAEDVVSKAMKKRKAKA